VTRGFRDRKSPRWVDRPSARARLAICKIASRKAGPGVAHLHLWKALGPSRCWAGVQIASLPRQPHVTLVGLIQKPRETRLVEGLATGQSGAVPPPGSDEEFFVTSDASRPDAIPPVRRCGSYTFGHDVHFIQANLSLREGIGAYRPVEKVGSDGTVTFADGSSVWHHNPARLKAALALAGGVARLGTRGVLRVASGEGAHYCFSVSQAPEPCRAETAEHRSGESLIEELLRRGGVLRSGLDVLTQMEQGEVSRNGASTPRHTESD
jgi:hypothetical protein